ncbi:hypothetical protein FRB99_003584, partial [Tulasnella sp. 403]
RKKWIASGPPPLPSTRLPPPIATKTTHPPDPDLLRFHQEAPSGAPSVRLTATSPLLTKNLTLNSPIHTTLSEDTLLHRSQSISAYTRQANHKI